MNQLEIKKLRNNINFRWFLITYFTSKHSQHYYVELEKNKLSNNQISIIIYHIYRYYTKTFTISRFKNKIPKNYDRESHSLTVAPDWFEEFELNNSELLQIMNSYLDNHPVIFKLFCTIFNLILENNANINHWEDVVTVQIANDNSNKLLLMAYKTIILNITAIINNDNKGNGGREKGKNAKSFFEQRLNNLSEKINVLDKLEYRNLTINTNKFIIWLVVKDYYFCEVIKIKEKVYKSHEIEQLIKEESPELARTHNGKKIRKNLKKIITASKYKSHKICV